MFAYLQYFIPKQWISGFFYVLSRSQIVWLKDFLISNYIKIYKIPLKEAKRKKVSEYLSFNDFFARELEEGARSIDQHPSTIISPCDGRIIEAGEINMGKLLQAKGRLYDREGLLRGSNQGLVDHLSYYLTIYLSPTDYHRVHAPIDGEIQSIHYIPGAKYSVNPNSLARISGIFTRNERLILWLESSLGLIPLVMVGALNVSSFVTKYTGEIKSGPERDIPLRDMSNRFQKGEEIGQFNLGSTVIMLLPKDSFSQKLSPSSKVLMGQAIGQIQGV